MSFLDKTTYNNYPIFKTLFTLFFIVTVNSFGSNSNNNNEIKYGYPDQSIFIATVNGKEQPITPMLDVAEELFKKAKLPLKANAYPAKRLFQNFKNGKTNFSILVRASSLIDSSIFSKNPIYSTNLNIYYIGDKPPILTKEDLIGKNVASIRGYSYGKLGKFIRDPKNNVTNQVTNTHNTAFKMLKFGRADYVLDYASAAGDIIKQNNIANIKSTTLSKLDIFLILSKSYPNAKEVMKSLETIVESMDIDAIIKKSGIKRDTQ